jgi:hypothetical protein
VSWSSLADNFAKSGAETPERFAKATASVATAPIAPA